jgi:hypothetical protein
LGGVLLFDSALAFFLYNINSYNMNTQEANAHESAESQMVTVVVMALSLFRVVSRMKTLLYLRWSNGRHKIQPPLACLYVSGLPLECNFS